MDDYHLPFQCEKALRQAFTQAHAAYALEGYETKPIRLVQKCSDDYEETGKPEATRMAGEERKTKKEENKSKYSVKHKVQKNKWM
jgi:hypothetical protein